MEYWVPTFPYNSSHIVVAMEQRVQMIPNIAAIYRRNKIVEEKFIQGRPHLYNIFGRCLFISS